MSRVPRGSAGRPAARHLALGAAGEDLAAAWYVGHGYDVVDRNWRCREGELDLIVSDGRTIVFCEVKTRSSLAFGSPFEAVDRDKRRRIRALAARWMEGSLRRPRQVRFDVVGVLDGEVEVIEGAF